MLECKDIDGQMMDWLYDELDDTSSAPFAEHIDGCARCQTELDSLTRTRAALRALPDDDPSPGITQILLHEAAKRAPSKRARATSIADDRDKPGALAWLFGWMKPALAHPGLAAFACLVLVAGVAGSLYVRGKGRTTEPMADEAKRTTHASDDSQPALIPSADQAARQRELGDGFEARLADEGDELAAPFEENAAAAPAARATVDSKDAVDRVLEEEPAPEQALERQSNQEREGGEFRTRDTRDRSDQNVDVKADLAKQEPKAPSGKAGNKSTGTSAPMTNAVTTADPLLDAEDYDDDVTGADASEAGVGYAETDNEARNQKDKDVGAAKEKKKQSAKPSKSADPAPPPADTKPTGAGGATYTVGSDPKKELEWAQTQRKKMSKLISAKKCKDAAVIANDILDRNPQYYYKNIDSSTEIKRCQWYVVDEQRRRSSQRAKNRRSSAGDASDELVEPMSTE